MNLQIETLKKEVKSRKRDEYDNFPVLWIHLKQNLGNLQSQLSRYVWLQQEHHLGTKLKKNLYWTGNLLDPERCQSWLYFRDKDNQYFQAAATISKMQNQSMRIKDEHGNL